VDRHVLATRDDVLAARRELRGLAVRHGIAHPRVTASGAVLISVPGDGGYRRLERFAAAAAAVVGAWVNVVAEDAPWAAGATDITPL
jgi:hypothetical protein